METQVAHHPTLVKFHSCGHLSPETDLTRAGADGGGQGPKEGHAVPAPDEQRPPVRVEGCREDVVAVGKRRADEFPRRGPPEPRVRIVAARDGHPAVRAERHPPRPPASAARAGRAARPSPGPRGAPCYTYRRLRPSARPGRRPPRGRAPGDPAGS